MAKKAAADFSDINKFLGTIDSNSGLLEDYKEIEPTMWIHTGNYLYNAHLSGSLLRGVPNNKIITIAGDPKTGKSYLVFNIMRGLIAAGYHIYFFETENSPDKERVRNQMIDMKKVTISQPETIEEIIVPLTKLTEAMKDAKKADGKYPKVAIIIDSISTLNSQKQINDALAGEMKADMGTVAKQLKQLYNMMAIRTGKLEMPMICTAHIYDKQIEGTTHKKRTASGGMAAIYLSSIVPFLRKNVERDKETKEKLGIHIISDIEEGRFARPTQIKTYVSFTKGMNPFVGLEDYVSWDVCGLDKGKFVDLADLANEMLIKKVVTIDNITEKVVTRADFNKHMSKPKLEFIDQHIKWMIENGYMALSKDGKGFNFTKKVLKQWVSADKGKYFPIEGQVGIVNKASSQWIVKHLGKAVPMKEFYTKEVFTDAVLKELDEKVIKPKFYFGDNKAEETVEKTDDLDDFYKDGEKK